MIFSSVPFLLSSGSVFLLFVSCVRWRMDLPKAAHAQSCHLNGRQPSQGGCGLNAKWSVCAQCHPEPVTEILPVACNHLPCRANIATKGFELVFLSGKCPVSCVDGALFFFYQHCLSGGRKFKKQILKNRRFWTLRFGTKLVDGQVLDHLWVQKNRSSWCRT